MLGLWQIICKDTDAIFSYCLSMQVRICTRTVLPVQDFRFSYLKSTHPHPTLPLTLALRRLECYSFILLLQLANKVAKSYWFYNCLSVHGEGEGRCCDVTSCYGQHLPLTAPPSPQDSTSLPTGQQLPSPDSPPPTKTASPPNFTLPQTSYWNSFFVYHNIR